MATLARKIVERIKKSTAPGACTWGDEYPEAHADLFEHYMDDLIHDVARLLPTGEGE